MKISLGSGGVRFDGWVHIDADSRWQPDVCMDLRQPLPFADGEADYMHSEDFIGQLTLHEAEAFFRECHRLLRPDGVLRLLTPDLRQLLTMYVEGDLRLRQLWETEVGIPLKTRTLGELVNQAMTFSGQKFFYDEETLRAVMEPLGFELQRTGCNESAHPELRALDLRTPENAISMYFDCRRL
jgi:predicted SAM-dependent methyltransferase